MLSTQTQKMLSSSVNNNFRFLDRNKFDYIADEVAPGSRASRKQQSIFFPLLYFVDQQGFGIGIDFSVGVEILFLKGHKFIKYTVVQHQAHGPAPGIGLVGDESF